MMFRKDPEPDPYLRLTDPDADPGGPNADPHPDPDPQHWFNALKKRRFLLFQEKLVFPYYCFSLVPSS
jgi:hypothetical protein